MRRSAQIVKCSLLGDKNLNIAKFIKKLLAAYDSAS